MTFLDFNFDPRTLEGISAMGFETPTSIQQQVIPEVMKGRDLIGTAQTGTGKTAAYLLPVIDHIVRQQEQLHKIHTLIIVPTRELAQQIDQQAVGMSFFCGVSSTAIYGGGESLDWDRQKRAITSGTDILIATPGRILSHLRLGYVNLDYLKFFILDEADRMLDMGFHEDILDILAYIKHDHQTMMFSATMPGEIRKLAAKLLKNPVNISIALSKPAEGVVQAAYVVHDKQKLPLLKHLVKDRDLNTVLVFSSTKRNVKEIANLLANAGLQVKAIHSDLEQQEREAVLLEFRNRQIQILVATDVLSRGIDIDGIDLVLNYDVPQDAEDYIHRVGRTARADASGLAITFINSKERGSFSRIEQLMDQKVRLLPVPEIIGPPPASDHSETSDSHRRDRFKSRKGRGYPRKSRDGKSKSGNSRNQH